MSAPGDLWVAAVLPRGPQNFPVIREKTEIHFCSSVFGARRYEYRQCTVRTDLAAAAAPPSKECDNSYLYTFNLYATVNFYLQVQ